MKDKALCITCGEYVKYDIIEVESTIEYKNKSVIYKEKQAICKKCHEQMDVPGLWDGNLERIKEAYRRQYGER